MGLFFTGPPMYQYGGTPMGYAASFCCRKAIALYLSLAYTDKVRGFIDLNDSSNLCVYSGFSPLHAVVCNGYKSMYDFLADLPDVRPATPAHAAMSPTTPQPHTTSHTPPASYHQPPTTSLTPQATHQHQPHTINHILPVSCQQTHTTSITPHHQPHINISLTPHA